MTLDPEFVEDERQKALHKWKWKNPFLAGFLAFLHPLGMLYTSVPAFVVYLAAWFAMLFFWRGRPLGTGIALGFLFALYAYHETKWRNAAVEMWRYGLRGNGNDNPRKLGLELKGPDAAPMSAFSARIYWLEWRILKKHQSPFGLKVASLLRFKVPVTPPALAGSLLMMAGYMMEAIKRDVFEGADFTSEKEALGALGEILRAYYCLAVVVLGEDEFASNLTEYNLYTAKTYEELKQLVDKKAPRAVCEKMMDEATVFYLQDKPPLAQYAETMRQYCQGDELEHARNPDPRVWFYRFMLKVRIRIAAALSIVGQDLFRFLTLTIVVSGGLSANTKAFRRMRPVFWDPTEPEVR